MNRLSTKAKAIAAIALVALLIAVPIEIVAAQIPDNPADSLERPAEVVELALVETCPETGIRVLTPEEMELLQGDIDIQLSQPISGELLPGVWRAHGGWLFDPGGTMVISVTWTPAASRVWLGARCADTGQSEGRTFVGGHATIGLGFPYGGRFEAIVDNRGPYTISYSGIVDVGGIVGGFHQPGALVRVDIAFGETCPETGIRALTPEEVQRLGGNGFPEVPGLGPWVGFRSPGRGPILFSTCENALTSTAEMVEAGRLIVEISRP